jgi:hypothetical protein
VPALTSRKTLDCEICGAVLKSQRELDNHLCLLHDEYGAARLGAPIAFRCAAERHVRRCALLSSVARDALHKREECVRNDHELSQVDTVE